MKQGSRSSFMSLTGWGLHQLVSKFPLEQQLKARQSAFFFSMVNTFKAVMLSLFMP
jgi:hypothetical protein